MRCGPGRFQRGGLFGYGSGSGCRSRSRTRRLSRSRGRTTGNRRPQSGLIRLRQERCEAALDGTERRIGRRRNRHAFLSGQNDHSGLWLRHCNDRCCLGEFDLCQRHWRNRYNRKPCRFLPHIKRQCAARRRPGGRRCWNKGGRIGCGYRKAGRSNRRRRSHGTTGFRLDRSGHRCLHRPATCRERSDLVGYLEQGRVTHTGQRAIARIRQALGPCLAARNIRLKRFEPLRTFFQVARTNRKFGNRERGHNHNASGQRSRPEPRHGSTLAVLATALVRLVGFHSDIHVIPQVEILWVAPPIRQSGIR